MTLPAPRLVALVLLVAAAPGAAQEPPDPRSEDQLPLPPLPPLVVRRTAGPIALDGQLDDPGWRDATPIERFWETQPGDNVAPQVATVAYLVYDERYFYVGLRCLDPEPDEIRAPYVDRDLVFGTDDNVAVFLDTRNDRRSAVELRVNPRGIQGDAIFNDTTQTEDFSPDFFYDTAARITEEGWTAEMRIPFTSLRYPELEEQTWGILIWRNYPRAFRYAIHSSPIPRGSNCFVCHSRPIVGLSALPSTGGIVAAPYVSGQDVAAAARPGVPLVDEPTDAEVGLDVKWTPSAETALDLTLNPDFSQVEADVPQIAVNNRFALFFPEKRPFFLEAVDLLESPIQAVYTRTLTSPRWGGRATGRLAGTAYTVLLAQDRGGGSVVLPGPTFSDLAPQDFRAVVGIARARRELGRSYVGALATLREIEGGGHNRVVGPDFQWRPTERDRVNGQFLRSDTRTPNRPDLAPEWDGRSLTSHGLELSWSRSSPTFEWDVEYADYGEGFRADSGFVPQVGYREYEVGVGRNFFPEGVVRQARPYVGFEYSEDRRGGILNRSFVPGVFFIGRKNLVGNVEMQASRVRAVEQVLDRTRVFFFLQVDPSRRFTRVTLQGTAGQEIDFAHDRVGTGADVTLTLTLRPTDRLTFDGVLARRALDVDTDLGDGRLFTAWVYRAKATYNFSARAFLRLIGQYVASDRDPTLYDFPVARESGSFFGSALFSYRLNWQTALFLGYGDDRALDPAGNLERTGRQIFFKVSYAFQR